MADCRACNAPITWAIDPTGERIPLDDHELQDQGSDRYRIVTDSVPPRVEPIPEESPLRTFVDHRRICQQPRAI